MTYEAFDKTLESLDLNKKDFANTVRMSYTSVTNWKQSGEVAGWVESWLENYAKAQALDKITQTIKPFLKSDNGKSH